MAEFIGGSTSSQLLILMSFPLIGALLLAGALFFLFRRGRKKSGMKHGIQLKDEDASESALELDQLPPVNREESMPIPSSFSYSRVL